MSEPNDLDIAVIGMTCRFPGASSPEEFWHNLRSGVESISFFSAEELIEAGVDRDLVSHPDYVRASATLADVEQFDAAFFGFSPNEAAILDPQHRLFLECAWEALERAGYAPHDYAGAISVHAGTGASSYLLENLYANRDELAAVTDLFQVQTGNDKDHLATRVSYKLNLRGPSMSIQTACSTSLVAIHMACQSLLNGESDIALAGGVTIQLPQKTGYLYRQGMILSPDGHCRAFDLQADGTVGGSGAGVVVLRRLAHALADGDQIYAVVRGSAINNDGSLKVGYTAPGASGQKAVIMEALAIADVDPATITLVEAHGTGTELGDPVELAALTQAFRATTSKKQYCALGSVKTNVGHLDAAAGVCGFIKAVLALHHQILPPSLHFTQPNPNIDFASSPFYVCQNATAWVTPGHPRRAGVSSFGIGGTNAHIILEEAPAAQPSAPARGWQVLPLSARTRSALESATQQLVRYLAEQPDCNLADVAHTLQVGRHPMPYRRAIVCQTAAEVVARWGEDNPERPSSCVQDTSPPELVFMFPGQGAQHSGMARDLYEREPAFRTAFDRCATIVAAQLGQDLRAIIYPADASQPVDASAINQTVIAQPALFSVEYALAQLWAAWGIKPQRMIGHSLGEYVAACLAGVFSLEDALAIVCLRGRLMQDLPPGAMLAVALPESVLRARLTPQLALAAVNGPELCVVAGPHDAIASLAAQLAAEGLAPRQLQTSHAFHSTMMNPMLEPFARQLEQIQLNPPRLPFLSNVTGTWITAEQATSPLYWAAQIAQTVRFGAGLEQLLDRPGQILLEVGPGRTLSSLARQHPRKTADQLVLTSLRHPQDQQPDGALILRTLGLLWCAGVPVDWARINPNPTRRRLRLPTYPFERQRHWIAARPSPSPTPKAAAAIGKRPALDQWFYVPSWKRTAPPRGNAAAQQRWLVFTDRCGIGPAIAARLQAADQQIVTVQTGATFQRLSDHSYQLNPLDGADYARLLETLAAAGQLPQQIVHCWNVTGPGAELAERAQSHSFASLFGLAQAIGRHMVMEDLDLTVVVTGLHAISGDETLSPEKALLIGPCKVLPQELPNKRSRCIDIELPGIDPGTANRLAEQLLAELLTPIQEPTIAYRGRHRWVQIYEPVALPPAETAFAAQGTFLITGGLGGMGLALAQHLATTRRARLVLVGRSALPPREHWDTDLAQPAATLRTIRTVQALERAGAELEIVAADVSDLEQMRMVFAQARARFGRIDGIIHAAGVIGAGSMERKTMPEAAAVLAAKVRGTTVLAQLSATDPPDFVLLCSSLRSIVGGAGQADYCAANAFLEAYATAASQQSRPAVTAITWDGWQEVGMSADTAGRMQLDPASLSLCLTTQEGLEVFERALASGLPQVIVSAIPLEAQIERERQALDLGALNQPQPALSSHPRPDLATPYVAPSTPDEQRLARIWQEVFGIDRIGIHDNFFELGGDSISGLRVVARANEQALRLTPAQIFEHQTIAGLAQVAGQLQSAADQGLVAGPVPLTPIQHWFFDQHQPEPHHFNQAVIVSVPAAVQPEHLAAALEHLVSHHDALRLRFVPAGATWQQAHVPDPPAVRLATIDLAAIAAPEQSAALEAHATQLQGSLNITQGPLLGAALFRLGRAQPNRLLLVIHHLVVDGLSWRILLADLETAIRQLLLGEPIQLPAKTTAFKAWSEQLALYARSDQAWPATSFWLAQLQRTVAPLPRDRQDGPNLVRSMRRIAVALDPAETAALQALPKVVHLQLGDILAAALAQTLARWSEHATVMIDVEAQGRDLPLEQVDLTRTVGWFTALYPLILECDLSQPPSQLLGAVRDHLRALPDNGLSYGGLRYLAPVAERLAALPQAEIVFLHLGQLATAEADGMFGSAEEPFGPTRSLAAKRPYLLEVTSVIAEGRLQFEWLYSHAVHTHATIEQLAAAVLDTLRTLIDQGRTPAVARLAPADFPLAGLDDRKLEKIAALLSKSPKRKER